MEEVKSLFTDDALSKLFPPARSNDFFDALFGDASEGSYDIGLKFSTYAEDDKQLHLELHLVERPGKCLACNLTYGLPEVFSRHPVINIKGLVADIDQLLAGKLKCQNWSLMSTRTVSSNLHVIPLVIHVE